MLLTVLQSLPWPALWKSLSAAAAAARRCALMPEATLSLRSGLRENQHRPQVLQGLASSIMQQLEVNTRGCRVKQVAVRHWLILRQGWACTLTGEHPDQQDLAGIRRQHRGKLLYHKLPPGRQAGLSGG